MKKLLLLAATAYTLAGCGGPTANGPVNSNGNANTNANAAKPVAAAPTKEALLDLDKKANDAFVKGDSAHFEGMLSDKFVGYMYGERFDKAAEIKMIASSKCDVKSMGFEDAQMAKINDDAYVLTYKSTVDGSCTMEGKSEKLPSPVRASSLWIRNGDKWQGAFHSETLIIDPKAAPPPPAKAEPKKEEPKKTTDKPAPAKPVGDANTDVLVKLHQGGWEAFKAKDAKKFEETLAAGFSGVDPMGTYYATKSDAIKAWTETMKCEGITKVTVTDGVASAISPNIEILTAKGNADGKCDGHANGDLFQTAIYVKEGDVWKLAFMFESPPMM